MVHIPIVVRLCLHLDRNLFNKHLQESMPDSLFSNSASLYIYIYTYGGGGGGGYVPYVPMFLTA